VIPAAERTAADHMAELAATELTAAERTAAVQLKTAERT
jgi:hypothetical protein